MVESPPSQNPASIANAIITGKMRNAHFFTRSLPVLALFISKNTLAALRVIVKFHNVPFSSVWNCRATTFHLITNAMTIISETRNSSRNINLLTFLCGQTRGRNNMGSVPMFCSAPWQRPRIPQFNRFKSDRVPVDENCRILP